MRAQQREVLDRPDECIPLDEPALLPQQAVELGRVIWAEPTPEHELLRRRDGRDRIDLEEAQLPDGVQDRPRGSVEQLCANSDSACVLESDDPCADGSSLDRKNVEQSVYDARIEMRARAFAELGHGVLGRAGFPVRAISRHCAPGVARAHDALR
jgi:hypothetical protein